MKKLLLSLLLLSITASVYSFDFLSVFKKKKSYNSKMAKFLKDFTNKKIKSEREYKEETLKLVSNILDGNVDLNKILETAKQSGINFESQVFAFTALLKSVKSIVDKFIKKELIDQKIQESYTFFYWYKNLIIKNLTDTKEARLLEYMLNQIERIVYKNCNINQEELKNLQSGELFFNIKNLFKMAIEMQFQQKDKFKNEMIEFMPEETVNILNQIIEINMNFGKSIIEKAFGMEIDGEPITMQDIVTIPGNSVIEITTDQIRELEELFNNKFAYV